MYFRPPAHIPQFAEVLYVPPFCQELDNSRAISAMCFRKLAASGVGVLSIDLPGCGDSEGNFEDFSWGDWKSSVFAGFQWLRQNSRLPISLCGMRLGATLALDVCGDYSLTPQQVVLLQPVISGEEMMTQYLRARVAFTGLLDVSGRAVSGQRVTVAALRQRLMSGESLEVAGYLLRPDLVAAIDAVKLERLYPGPTIPIAWIENAPSRPAVDGWCERVGAAAIHRIAVKPFWSHTRGDPPEYESLAQCLVGVFSKIQS